MSNTNTQDPLIKAARALCKYEAGVCQINEDDLWTRHAEDFTTQVQIVSDALQPAAAQPQDNEPRCECNDSQDQLCEVCTAHKNLPEKPQDMREAFEAWGRTYKTPEQGWWFRQLDDGGYSAHEPNVAWAGFKAGAAWQAATAQASEPSAERENQNGLFQTSPFQTAHSPDAAQIQQQAALQAGLASKAQPHDAPPDETGAAQSVGHATLGKAVRPGLSVLTRQPDEPIGIVRYTSTDRCVVDWLGELPRASTQIYAAPARAVEPLTPEQVADLKLGAQYLSSDEGDAVISAKDMVRIANLLMDLAENGTTTPASKEQS